MVAAVAFVAIAAWPFLGMQQANASHAYVAPVLPDYSYRDETVAFYERQVREDRQDQISAAVLAAQYMQRYRENLDVGDILRAVYQGKRALRLQPQNNNGALEVLASAYYALHDFEVAYRYEAAAHQERPDDSNAPAQMALLQMELGRYEAARKDIAVARAIKNDPGVWAAQARYDELTGDLATARQLMGEAAQRSDEVIDNSAESRAWYHYRLGEMAFSAGDVSTALSQERTAIAQFPNFEMAYRALARFCWGLKDWHCALQAATSGAQIVPDPETLGYKSDAQRALGDFEGARQTQQLIFAVERIGNAYHISDRLLSVYYAEHGVRLRDALAIARREVRRRGDEIQAQDTLAWAAAMDGHWTQAYRAMRQAVRYRTQDSRILYHAGVIERHFAHRERARAYMRQALRLNPHFDPYYADAARLALQQLSQS